MIMDQDRVVAEAKALAPWHFDFEILPNIRTGSLNPERNEVHDMNNVRVVDPDHMRALFNKYYPVGLSEKTLLDVGCNSGGYCFLAAELGARLATGFDVRSHWINQANFIHRIKYGAQDNVTFETGDAKTYIESHEPVDIVIFKGVLYHLPDPLHVLLQLAQITREMILVDTASSDAIPETCWTPIRESKTHVMSGIDGLAWLPGGPAAIRPILEYAGFKTIDVSYWRHDMDQIGGGRFQLIGLRQNRHV